MQSSLREKRAFFKELGACIDHDDRADALPTKEQSLRRECQAFFSAAHGPVLADKPSSKSPSKPELASAQLRRTTSDLVYNLTDDGIEIIAVTPAVAPGDDRSRLATVSLTGSLIPETGQQPGRGAGRPRRETHPSTRVLRSHSSLDSSPSATISKRKRKKSIQMVPESEQIFRGLKFFYIPNDDVNPARRLRITKAREHGATWTQDLAEATHVIVDNGLVYDDIKHVLDKDASLSSIILVNDRYPLDCLKRRAIFNPNDTVEKYQYRVPGYPTAKEPTGPVDLTDPAPFTQGSDNSLQIKPRRGSREVIDISTQETTQRSIELIPSSIPGEACLSDRAGESRSEAQTPAINDELASCIEAVVDDPETHEYLDESDTDMQAPEEGISPNKKRKDMKRPVRKSTRTKASEDKFVCMRGGTMDKRYSGPNAHIIKLLEEMAEEHSLWDETWRVQSYRKAVATLRRQAVKITTVEKAAALPNIGKSLAKHIEEIASTGCFRKLDELRKEPSREALKLFRNIYGVGVGTAKKWVDLGYRSLSDLRARAKLSVNQQIGIDYYDDLLTRIPRAEVRALGAHVKNVAARIDADVEIIIGGSYRRGAEDSGDIDLIVTKKGTESALELVPFLDQLVDALTKEGFLTAALASSHRHEGGNKWHGCCVLPETTALSLSGPPNNTTKRGEYRPIWRRIDFLLVPETEIGAALIYFTGNDLFNCSMRLLARKKGMKLNHRALTGVGVLEGGDERRIFEILGVRWREPHERWC